MTTLQRLIKLNNEVSHHTKLARKANDEYVDHLRQGGSKDSLFAQKAYSEFEYHSEIVLYNSRLIHYLEEQFEKEMEA